MTNWYGSLNIDGVQVAWTMGSKESVLKEITHYYMMYGEDIDDANKRVTMTIQKGKRCDTC